MEMIWDKNFGENAKGVEVRIQAWIKPPGINSCPGGVSCDNHEWTAFHDIRLTGHNMANSNRIDKWTSGLLLGASKGVGGGKSFLTKIWPDVRKYYLCVTEDPPWDVEVCDGLVYGKTCKTEFRRIHSYGGLALLRAELVQNGRTHQIRKHARALGYTIVDDGLWRSGPKVGARPGQLLHCWQMEVPMPDGSVEDFEAPVTRI